MHPLHPLNPNPLRLSGWLGPASIRDDTGVLQPEMQGVARGDPRAQHALHTIHGRFARRRTHEGLAEAACAARCEASALRNGQQVEGVHHAVSYTHLTLPTILRV